MPHSFFKQKEENYLYSGFIGLNTNIDNFKASVMQPAEVCELFSNSQCFDAPFVYPFLPADGFKQPVIFSGENITDQSFTLKAEIVTNDRPKSLASWIAGKLILPDAFVMKDHIQFFHEPDNGFGRGAFHITSVACETLDGLTATCAKACLSVENRPGLFLKIANQQGGWYSNAAIFFPDRAKGLMHKAVQFGEAFVLTQQGCEISNNMLEDIRAAFDLLVKRSYGEEGLYRIEDHIALDDITSICNPIYSVV